MIAFIVARRPGERSIRHLRARHNAYFGPQLQPATMQVWPSVATRSYVDMAWKTVKRDDTDTMRKVEAVE
jgi:hypothetical protein